jgi:glycogen debranching enzyme
MRLRTHPIRNGRGSEHIKQPVAELRALDGSTFFVSDESGDVEAVRAEGFFHEDMRHLSRWRLLVDGDPPRTLSSGNVDYYSVRVVGSVADADGSAPALAVRRERFVSGGLHEDVFVENLTDEPRRVELVLEFASDFGDILECRTRPKKRGRVVQTIDDDQATLRYERGDFTRATVIRFSRNCRLDDGRATFAIELEPRESWKTCVDVLPVVDGDERPSGHRCGDFGSPRPDMPLSLDDWLKSAPRLEADWHALERTYERSLVDLAALRFRPFDGISWSLPAGGLPWYMALFGRDSIIASFQLLPFQPRLARATLEALAELQARERDDARDAEPGKIIHELRRGELAVLGDLPFGPYYGTHDATPLFLILLDEYERWTGDAELVRALEAAGRAAVRWIEEEGDLDGDGFLDYRRRAPGGLDNQAWKDSWNSILFADGTQAEPPIATCEVQGYVYDALRRTARLARELWDDPSYADRLDRRADELRSAFDEAFWIRDRGHYALALDGEKRQVDALTSNVGHLLWSGILPRERAAATITRLTSRELFTGWGVRTMAAGEGGYNPLEYHNGTVWPHDTALIAEGMRRYGYRDEASILAVALLEAADAFDGRLPELFAGFDRSDTSFPIEYPDASRPQAFAAGATLLALRTLLGLDARGGELVSDPHVPASIGRVKLSQRHAGEPGEVGRQAHQLPRREQDAEDDEDRSRSERESARVPAQERSHRERP